MTIARLPTPWLARRLLPALLPLACAAHAAADGSTAANEVRAPGQAAQVLVLNGTDPYLPAFVAIDGAMRAAVERRHRRLVGWMHESIDTARFGGAPGALLADLLARKYRGVRIDAVVLVTEPAVTFYLAHRDRLWPQAAAIFHSVAPSFVQQLPADAGLSGLSASVDYAGAVRIGLQLQPEARRVVLVGGAAPFDTAQLAAARAALAPWAGRLEIEALVGLSPTKAAARLARETLDSVVVYTTMLRDDEGQVHVPREVLETLATASGAPIYGSIDSYLGHGLAAGAVESFSARGERVADLLVHALDSADAGSARIAPAPASTCAADGRQLARFGLRAGTLPQGCEVRYVEPSFLQRYAWQSLLVLLALAAQSLLIASLLWQRRRRRAAELGLQAQRTQLLHASRLALAGELTASIAHEINQPLGAILSNADAAEMLLESGRMPRDELLRILADIRRDDLRASEVIRRLRSLLARHATERRRFDVNEAVEDAAAILRAEARRRGVRVELALQARRAEVLGDPVQIQQVIINLMLNAFDASADVPEESRRVLVETANRADGVELRVIDFGTGIAHADLPSIFESFFSTKRGGMGLGLAIARSIVEAHGGTIAAASGKVGAVFRVFLPSTAAAPDRAERSAQNLP